MYYIITINIGLVINYAIRYNYFRTQSFKGSKGLRTCVLKFAVKTMEW
jgi:hypothetical protein